ncbi:MAG: hypothetical protein ACI8RD_000375 [Bacillariaceae sp.]|jgi:hypothetical protein
MSNNLDILSVEQIRSLYGIGDSQEVPFHECDGPGCGKEQSKQNKFKKCSRCWGRKYCSKECQAKDWKGRHKLQCRVNKMTDTGGEMVKVEDGINDDILERIEYFKEKYGRLLQIAALNVLLIGPNGTNPNQTLYNKTHVPILILEDLPSSAKYPRLSIQTAVTIPIAMLGETYRKSINGPIRRHRKHGDPELFVVNVGLTLVDTAEQNVSVYTPFSYGPDFLDWKGDDVRSIYEQYKNTVNAMAAGNAKHLVATIKRNA